jgi:hypothetical protein
MVFSKKASVIMIVDQNVDRAWIKTRFKCNNPHQNDTLSSQIFIADEAASLPPTVSHHVELLHHDTPAFLFDFHLYMVSKP